MKTAPWILFGIVAAGLFLCAMPPLHAAEKPVRLNVYAKTLSPDLQHQVRDALHAWEESAHGMVSFTGVDTLETADITLNATSNQLYSTVGEFANARCDVETLSKGPIQKAHILIATHDPYTQKPFSSEILQFLLLHEIGHALGLPHSPMPQDVMFTTLTSSPPQSPSVQDIANLHHLYNPALEEILSQNTADVRGDAVKKRLDIGI